MGMRMTNFHRINDETRGFFFVRMDDGEVKMRGK